MLLGVLVCLIVYFLDMDIVWKYESGSQEISGHCRLKFKNKILRSYFSEYMNGWREIYKSRKREYVISLVIEK